MDNLVIIKNNNFEQQGLLDKAKYKKGCMEIVISGNYR